MKRIDSPAQDTKTRIDKAKTGILGLIIAEEGQFKTGRGRFTEESLNRIVELGNAKSSGIRKRAQHPTASDDGLGSFVGRETNYRLDSRPNGSKIVRADVQFSEAAMTMSVRGGTPWGEYLIKELEDDPGSLQNSIVLRYDEVENDDPESDLAGVWMPTELVASDFVDSGDATHGDSLSSDDLVEWLTSESDRRIHTKLPAVVSNTLDRAFPGDNREKILTAFTGFTERYLDVRFGATNDSNPPETTVDEQTQAALSAVDAKIATLSSAIETLSEAIVADRVERKADLTAAKRSNEIASLCEQAGCSKAASYIADESLSVDDVRNKLFAQLCEQHNSLSDGEGAETPPSEFEKLGKEWTEGEALLSEAGWSRSQWIDAQCADRGIDKPVAQTAS